MVNSKLGANSLVRTPVESSKLEGCMLVESMMECSLLRMRVENSTPVESSLEASSTRVESSWVANNKLGANSWVVSKPVESSTPVVSTMEESTRGCN